MDEDHPGLLDKARQDADLSHGELWLRYFALGGMTAAMEIEAALHGALDMAPGDYNHIAHALNERFTELGRGTRIPYLKDRAAGGSQAGA